MQKYKKYPLKICKNDIMGLGGTRQLDWRGEWWETSLFRCFPSAQYKSTRLAAGSYWKSRISPLGIWYAGLICSENFLAMAA